MNELHGEGVLAAEYVLGSLDHATRLAVEQMMRTDPELARLVDVSAAAPGRCSPRRAAVEPPAAVGVGIEQALTDREAGSAPERGATGAAATEPEPRLLAPSTLAASALAAGLALYVAFAPPAAPARYVAVLSRVTRALR